MIISYSVMDGSTLQARSSHYKHLHGQQHKCFHVFRLESIGQTNMTSNSARAMNYSNGRYIRCCTWHIKISSHYLLDWKQLNATIYHQWLLLLLGSSRGLEEYLLHSKRQCPLFIIFDNKSCSIWSLTIFDNDQTLMLIHLGYSVNQSSLDNK